MHIIVTLLLSTWLMMSCAPLWLPQNTGLPPHVGTHEPVNPPPPNPCQAQDPAPVPLPAPSTHDPLTTPINHSTEPPAEPEPAWNAEREQLKRFVATMEAVTDKLKANEAHELWGVPTTLEREGDFVRATWPALAPNSPQPGLSLRPANNALSCVFDALGILRHWMLTPAQFAPAKTPPALSP